MGASYFSGLRYLFQTVKHPLSEALFGNNITDEDIFLGCNSNAGGLGKFQLAPPSAWGMEFNYRWGS